MRSSLEIWSVATGRSHVVLQTDVEMSAPNWDPVSDALLVNCGGRLFRVPLERPGLEPLETGFATACNNDHGFSPDGATIFLCHHRGNGAEMFRIPRAGGEPQPMPLPPRSWWHSASRDGARIAYAAARRQGRVVDIAVADADGRNERVLTPGDGHSDGPDFSADGARVYYNCDRGGHAQIWCCGVDGSGHHQVFVDENVNWFPHPSPCGRYLVWISYPPGTLEHPADRPVALCMGDPEGGNRRILAEFNGGQGTLNVPSWAPDGSAFAFVRYAPPAA